MSATSQHGFHPDAESLNAFAEQALRDRERAEVLEHLGVCARCREVVALAGEADAGGVEKALVPPRKAVRPNAWWKQWRFVWVPTAIVTAFAVASISAYIQLTDHRYSNFKIVSQNPPQGAAPTSTQPATEQAEVVLPATVAPAPPAIAAKHEHSRAAKQPAAQEPQFVAADAPPEPGTQYSGAADQIEVMRKSQPLTHAEAQQAPSRPAAAIGGPAYSQPAAGAWEARQKQAEEQRQEQADASRVHGLILRPAPSAARRANQPAPPAATPTDAVTAAPPAFMPQLLPDEPGVSAGLSSQRPGSLPIKPIHLPSGLAVVSSTSTGATVLAIDTAGTLFLSEDRGGTWERVKTQWTRRAVAVRQLSATNDALQSAPEAKGGTASGTSGNASPAPPSPVTFEILNDNNQAWLSTDGRIWTSK